MATKYKLLVLIDLFKTAHSVVKSAVNLAKAVNANIEVFYAKQLTTIVKNENQISAMRSLNEEQNITKKKLQNLVNTISKEENIPITFDFVFGNIKNEIIRQIETMKPDIIVLGKRKQPVFNFLRNDTTQFLLNTYFGNILIVDEDNELNSNSNISIGFYTDTLDDCNIEITKDLSKKASSSIKFFKVRKNATVQLSNDISAQLKTTHADKNIVEYEFEESTGALINFVSKNNIELLCVGREWKKKGWIESFVREEANMNKEIHKLKVPLFIYGK